MSREFLEQLAAPEIHTMENYFSHGLSLSTESKLQTFVDAGKSTLDMFLDRASTFLNGLKVGNYKRHPIVVGAKMKDLMAKEYSELRSMILPTPPGLSGNYLDLIGSIEKGLPAIQTLDSNLKLAIVKLAQILHEPDRLAAQSGIKEIAATIQPTLATVDHLDNLNANFKAGTRAEAQASQVISRAADLPETFKRLQALNEEMARVDFVNIQKNIHRLAELVKELEGVVKKDEHRELSGLVASQLSDTLYRLGVTTTFAITSATAVSDLVDALSNY